MTRPEFSGTRSLEFSSWVRSELPDSSTGLCVTNQDWIFWNWKTKKLLLAEEKTHSADLAKWFYRLIKEVLHPALREYCPQNGIEYLGYHLIQFENNNPSDGLIWFDRKEITEEKLRAILSLENEDEKP